MSKEILLVLETVSNEKSIPKEKLFEALESALVVTTKRKFPQETELRVSVNRKSGEIQTFRRWIVVADEPSSAREIHLATVEAKGIPTEIGSWYEEEVESIAFDRITTQVARQAIFQKIREASREATAARFEPKLGKLITGIVTKGTRDGWYLDISEGVEAYLPKAQTIPRESFRLGDRVRAVLYTIQTEGSGPTLQLSRTAVEMLTELLLIEVPEIGEGVIEVKAVARDPGSRAKVAVRTRDRRIDPVGACVGMRGSRIQAVSNELNGERVDVILWDANCVQYVVNAMAPAEVVSIVLDEDDAKMDIAVEEMTLAQAIGKNGQNVRLASQLTGWRLNIMTKAQLSEQEAQEVEASIERLKTTLDLPEETAAKLVEEGVDAPEKLTCFSDEELSEITGLSADVIGTLQKTVEGLQAQSEKSAASIPLADPELQAFLKTYHPSLADSLLVLCLENGIQDVELLAECSVDEFPKRADLDPVFVGQLIIAARKRCGWF